jgi:hypothetical protein
MEIVNDGMNIGISFSGISGFLLILYLIIELVTFMITGTSFIHKVFLYYMVKYRVKKSIPGWWDVSKVGFITISRVGFNRWYIFVDISRDIPGYEKKVSCEVLTVNNIGKIKNGSFDIGIKLYDEDLGEYLKTYNRNKALEKLGI